MAETMVSIEELLATAKVIDILSELPPVDSSRDLAYRIVIKEVDDLIKRVREIDDQAHMGGDVDAADPGGAD